MFQGQVRGLFRFETAGAPGRLVVDSKRFSDTGHDTNIRFAFADGGRFALVGAVDIANRKKPFQLYRVRLEPPYEVRKIGWDTTLRVDHFEAALSATGRYAATVRCDRANNAKVQLHIRYWDIPAGREATYDLEVPSSPLNAKFTSDATGLLVRLADRLLLLANPLIAADGRGKTLAFKAVSQDHTGSADRQIASGVLAVSGGRVLYTDWSNTLALADSSTLRTLWKSSVGDAASCVRCAAFTADGKRVGFVVHGVECGPAIRFLEAAGGRELTPPGNAFAVKHVLFHPNRPLLATAGAGTDLQLWSWERRAGATAFRPAGAPALTPPPAGPTGLADIQFIDGGRRLMATAYRGEYYECNLGEGAVLRTRYLKDHPTLAFHGLQFSEDGRRRIYLPGYGSQTIIATGARAVVAEVPAVEGGPQDGRFSNDGAVAAFARIPGGVTYVDTETGKRIPASRGPGAAFRGRERFLTTEFPLPGEKEKAYWLTDLRTDRRWCTRTIANAPLAYSPDGRYAAFADSDAGWKITVVELAGGGTVRSFPSGQDVTPEAPSDLAFSPDGKLLASAMPDGTVLIWDCDPCSSRMRHYGPDGVREMETALRGTNPKRAHAAIGWAIAHPAEAVAHFRAVHQPAPRPDREVAEKLLRRLADPKYVVRFAAARHLEKIEPLLPAWFEELKGQKLPVQVADVLGKLAAKPLLPRSEPDELFQVRMVECLERMGSPEAKAYLNELAEHGDWAALMAAIALERLGG